MVKEPDAFGSTSKVTYNLRLHKDAGDYANLAPNPQKPFDMALPRLTFTLDNQTVQARVGYDFAFSFGMDRQGIFINPAAVLDPATQPYELAITVGATLPPLSTTGHLGILPVQIQDVPGSPSRFDGVFAVDVTGWSALTAAAELSAHLTTTHDELHARARLATGDDAAKFPSVLADINVDWPFAVAPLFVNGKSVDPQSLGSRPTVKFDKVGLDVGSYISSVVAPVLNTVNSILEPVKPLLDIITYDIPVLDMSLADLAQKLGSAFGSPNIALIGLLADIAEQVTKIRPAWSSNLAVTFGSFDLGDADPRVKTFQLSACGPQHTTLQDTVLNQLRSSPGGVGKELADYLTDLEKEKNGLTSIIAFPLIDHPDLGFNFLLGKAVDLFTFSPPKLVLDGSVNIPVMELGPFTIRLEGWIKATAEMVFGYDTYGLVKFCNDPNHDPADILSGFYFQDTSFSLNGGLEARGGVDVLIVSAEVGGGVYANLEAKVTDPNPKGGAWDDPDPAHPRAAPGRDRRLQPRRLLPAQRQDDGGRPRLPLRRRLAHQENVGLDDRRDDPGRIQHPGPRPAEREVHRSGHHRHHARHN